MISDEVYVMQVEPIEEYLAQFVPSSQDSDQTTDDENSNGEPLSRPPAPTPEPQPTLNTNLNASDASDGQLCPICFDNWTSSGDHRICALKCGHLFGHSCINHWLTSQKEKNCPTCKTKVNRSEIRFIYAQKLIAVDTSELENMKKQLDKVVEDKNKVQVQLARALCREHGIELKVKELERQIETLKSALVVKQKFGQCSQVRINESSSTTKLYMEKSLEICKDSGCRVFSCFDKSDLIVVSMMSPNVIFPGYGVRCITASLCKPTSYVPLHSKAIRDLKFHSQNPWLLSVSLDQTAKVIDTNSNAPICVYHADSPLWSCSWDANDPNVLYLGQQHGSTVKLDMRKPSEPMCVFQVPGDMSPTIALASIPIIPVTASKGGIIVCKLNSLSVFRADNEGYVRYPLSVEGSFTSMTFERETQQLLLSTRPNSQYAYARHHLCYLENDYETGNLVSRSIHCLQGGTSQKFLSRSCFVSYQSNHYIAAHQESYRSVFLWNVRTGHKACYAPAPEPVLDLCGYNNLMLTLTEKKLMYYKFM